MEAERFDQAVQALTRSAAHRRGVPALSAAGRRGVLTLLGALLAAGSPNLDAEGNRRTKRTHRKEQKHHQAHDEGKKKKKKKKKKPPQVTAPPPPGASSPPGAVPPPPGPAPTCVAVGQSCADNCCSGLRCDTRAWCGPATDPHGPTCYAGKGGSCTNACDCHADLLCSERQGQTCQRCGRMQAPCASSEDCCFTASTCGDNGCEEAPNQVCCQGLDALCFDSCDCCADLICDEERQVCVPVPPLD